MPLLVALAALLALGTACPGPTTSEPEDAGKAGRDAGKAGLDAEEVVPPDADVVVVPPDAGALGPDTGLVAVDGSVVVPPTDAGTQGLDAALPGRDAGSAGLDAGSPGLDAGPPPNTFWLTLLHSSDTESAMVPSNTWGGVAYFTTVVKSLQAEAATWQPTAGTGEIVRTGTLVVSAGDNFLAGLSFKTSIDKGVPFYETIAMQEIGYQVSTLGNHDFDFGGSVAADFIRGFSPAVPFVSANVDFSAQAQLQAQVAANRLAKSYVVDVNGEDVGVIGAVTADLASVSNAAGLTVSAIATAVNAEAALLVGAGINKIVLLSHNQAVANDQTLVPLLHGVDIVVSGGGHEIAASSATVLATGDTKAVDYPVNVNDADGNPVPIVTAGSLYKYVGRLVAKFDLATGKLTAVDAARSTPFRVSNSGTTDAVAADSRVSTFVVTPITTATAALKTTVVATTAVPLDGRRNNVRTQETNEGNLMADAMLWQGRQLAAGAGVAVPVVGLVNGGGIRNDTILPAGTLSVYDTFSVAPFTNLTAILPAVSRDTLKAVLENAVCKVAAVDGRFLQVAGMKFTWDGSLPARDLSASPAEPGQRVRSVILDDGTVVVAGGVVQAGAAVPVSTIDFEARGGDFAPYGGTPFTIVNATYQEALMNYLKTGLGGVVSAAQYPTGGNGRITALNACGNGVIETGETCDDRNAVTKDGCGATCAIETGWTCSGAPSVCTQCGNGNIDALEQCDGSNLDGQTCATVAGFTGGTLACKSDCSFDTAGCAAAQRGDLAVFTFETSAPLTAGPFAAEGGSRAATSFASGLHTGNATYSSPAGNGSPKSFSANTWAAGDYYQVTVPATGAADLQVTWDQSRSATGPGTFKLELSTDGTTFQEVTPSYTVIVGNWTSTTPVTTTTFGPTLLPASANGAATVTLRFTSSVTMGSSGTCRIDNIKVTGLAP
jgi:5'-nucleotidase